MDFDLSRIDYAISGITYPETMKLLPSTAPKQQQKIVIGDKNGVLQCFGIKNEEPQIVFKTLPGKEITSVQLAGAPGTLADKIFTASGNEVKGYTRKGKVFLNLETNLSETITSMCVSGADLVIGSGNTVIHYRDLKEVETFMCEDRVLDIAIFNVINSTRIRVLVVVAIKGLLLFEHGKTVAKLTVPSGPTRLIVPPTDYQSVQDPVVFFGAIDGSVGIITVNGGEVQWRCLVEGRGLGAVTCLTWWAAPGAGYLLLGRHDGGVQVLLIDPDNFPEKPKLKYSYFCGETVTSVAGGSAGEPGASELLVATYSGRVFALRPRDHVPESQQAVATRLAKLRTEVLRLEKQVEAERERYQHTTRLPAAAGLSAPPVLDLEDRLTGISSDNWQELRLNCAVPLDLLFVYCEHAVTVQTDSAAVLSVCPPQDKSNEFLATVRCQAGTRRLWLKVRNSRPRLAAALRVYVVPAGAPRVARRRDYTLTSLAHYSLHESSDHSDGDRPLSELQVTGAFSVAELTSWLAGVVPDELPRPAAKVSFARRHSLVPTVLICQYTKGSATFKSDNVTTIAVLKDSLSKCSVKRNIRVDISCIIAENCVWNSYKSIEELLNREYQRTQEDYLRKALRDLDLDLRSGDDTSAPLVCEEYLHTMRTAAGEDNSKHQLLIEIVLDWYADGCELALRPCSPAVQADLADALAKNHLERLVAILGGVG